MTDVHRELPRRLAVARAAAAGLLLAFPTALVNSSLADQDPPPRAALNLTLLGLLAGFLLAGVVAGLELRRDAIRGGALAAFATFVPCQLIGIVGRLDRGDSVALGQVIVLGLLAACVGTVGARLGAARRRRRLQPLEATQATQGEGP